MTAGDGKGEGAGAAAPPNGLGAAAGGAPPNEDAAAGAVGAAPNAVGCCCGGGSPPPNVKPPPPAAPAGAGAAGGALNPPVAGGGAPPKLPPNGFEVGAGAPKGVGAPGAGAGVEPKPPDAGVEPKPPGAGAGVAPKPLDAGVAPKPPGAGAGVEPKPPGADGTGDASVIASPLPEPPGVPGAEPAPNTNDAPPPPPPGVAAVGCGVAKEGVTAGVPFGFGLEGVLVAPNVNTALPDAGAGAAAGVGFTPPAAPPPPNTNGVEAAGVGGADVLAGVGGADVGGALVALTPPAPNLNTADVAVVVEDDAAGVTPGFAGVVAAPAPKVNGAEAGLPPPPPPSPKVELLTGVFDGVAGATTDVLSSSATAPSARFLRGVLLPDVTVDVTTGAAGVGCEVVAPPNMNDDDDEDVVEGAELGVLLEATGLLGGAADVETPPNVKSVVVKAAAAEEPAEEAPNINEGCDVGTSSFVGASFAGVGALGAGVTAVGDGFSGADVLGGADDGAPPPNVKVEVAGPAPGN